MKVLFGVNFYRRDPQHMLCAEMLHKHCERYKGDVGACNLQYEDGEDSVHMDGIVDYPFLKTRCRDLVKGSNSGKPVVYEMLDAMSAVDCESFALLNSDIYVCDSAVRECMDAVSCDCRAFSRVNVRKNTMDEKGLSFVNDYPSGFDMFWFRRDWWLENRQHFRNLPNIYGERAWDNAYAIMAKLCGRTKFCNKTPMIMHFRHSGNWGTYTPEGKFCGKIWDASGFDKLWGLYNGLVLKRRRYDPDGNVVRIESEEDMEDAIFNWKTFASFNNELGAE